LNALTTSGGGDVIPADALFGIAKPIINKKRKRGEIMASFGDVPFIPGRHLLNILNKRNNYIYLLSLVEGVYNEFIRR